MLPHQREKPDPTLPDTEIRWGERHLRIEWGIGSLWMILSRPSKGLTFPCLTLAMEGDDNAFLVDYLQRLEGVRPDVEIYNRQGRGRDLVSQGEGLDRAKRRWEAESQLWHDGRAVFVTTLPPKPLVPGARYVPSGLVYQLTQEQQVGGRSVPDDDPVARPEGVLNPRERLAAAGAEDGFRDPWLSKLAANYWWMAGEHERAGGDREAALNAYRMAAGVAPQSRSTLYNVAVRLMQSDRPEESYEMIEAVLDLDPAWPQPYRLAADLLKRLGREADLTRLYERARIWGAFP